MNPALTTTEQEHPFPILHLLPGAQNAMHRTINGIGGHLEKNNILL